MQKLAQLHTNKQNIITHYNITHIFKKFNLTFPTTKEGNNYTNLTRHQITDLKVQYITEILNSLCADVCDRPLFFRDPLQCMCIDTKFTKLV